MERIEKLRLKAFFDNRFGADTEFYTLFYKKYQESSALPEEARYADAFYYAFSYLTPAIADGELIVGNRNIQLSHETEMLWNKQYKDIAVARCKDTDCGQDSHMAIDYPLILSKGLNGIIRQIDQYLKICEEEKKEFYLCCKKCLQAVIKHAEAYGDYAAQLYQNCDNAQRKAELKKIAETCKKVPAQPAQTFYEALQSIHFVTHCLSFNPLKMNQQQFQLGHPDRYLFPYYEKDVQSKTLTKEYAQLLLDCLGIQINMRVPNGLSSGYMVGGRDENGTIVSNDLTRMCMQTIKNIRLVYPAVGLCYTKDTPEQDVNLACELLLEGHSHPALFQDDVITKGLRAYGVDEELAHNYIHSTCVEITPIAASNVWVASPYTNMPQLLLDIMDCEYPSFDALIQKYFSVLDTHIKLNFENENKNRARRAANAINPLLSCFVKDCLAQGADIERGGARYNWIMPSFVGMSNLIDSFYSLKTLVFEEKKLTMREFLSILNDNYKDHNALRLYICNKIPKYGNDIDEVDCLYGIVAAHIAKECTKYHGLHSNANLIPSVFCWIIHEHFGKATKATPDGRCAGFPLGDGSGPCQGRETNGPTASVLSSTKWDHHKFIGGVAVNLKFSKDTLGNNSLDTIKALLKTYLNNGGFEVQVNVVDNDTLRKAQKKPENYKDLVVRIGGYSDYFVRLSREMQEEVIQRSVHYV